MLSSDPKHPGPPPDDEDREAAASAAAFGDALAAFEKETPAAAPVARKPAAQDPHRVGARVKGRIVSIAADSVLLDIGARSEAVADAREFRGPDGTLSVNVGDTLELHVVEVAEPLVVAKTAPKSARRKGGGGRRVSLEAVRQAKEGGLPVRGKVTSTNSGGWTVDVDGVRAFCPASQADLRRVEDLTPFVGRVLEFLVIEVDESKRRVIVSRRAFLSREQAEQAKAKLAQLTPGQELEGTVSRIEPFGAFVDLGGLEGLVHVSELSHARVAHARDVVAVGDHVRVRVLRVEAADERRPRVALSIRALAPDPWAEAAGKFSAGMRVPGVVVRLADFGAFVNLAPGVDGLVHVSQVSDQRVAHVRDVLSPGQAVEVVVLTVEPERKRISLSMREAIENPVEGSRMTREAPGAGAPPGERGGERRRERGPRGDREARGERGPRGGRDMRGERGSRGDRGPRGERGPRRDRERGGDRPREAEREIAEAVPPRRAEPEALTTMQLAFRKAREAQQRRESKE